MALPVRRRRGGVDRRRDSGPKEARRDRADLAPAQSPWAELAALHERMGRLLSEVFDSDLFDAAFERLERMSEWRPAADVEETADEYVVEVELPGVKREDISVEFGGGELAITGEVKQRERVGFLRSKTRPVGRFDYRVSLPAEVEEQQVSASLADGVLTVRVPKAER